MCQAPQKHHTQKKLHTEMKPFHNSYTSNTNSTDMQRMLVAGDVKGAKF